MNPRVFYPLHNTIKHYPWGSKQAFSTLFAISDTDGQPQAEIWMGAHPSGCSVVEQPNGTQLPLSELINQEPETTLGLRVSQQFGELPFLLKVLAAQSALSLQVHPEKTYAEQGFLREQQMASGDYHDGNHKPELVYALTPFMAMNGFRPYDDIIHHFELLDAPEIKHALADFKAQRDESGLQHFFIALMQLETAQRSAALARLEEKNNTGVFPQITPYLKKLIQDYPGDIGLLSPLLLHCITLDPGEAMFLWPGTLHAYIQGVAVEVMANSDNVLRAGLTAKKINLPELVRCTHFHSRPENTLTMKPVQEGHFLSYPVPVEDFRFTLSKTNDSVPVMLESVQIILVMSGHAMLSHANGETLNLVVGQSAFIPASTGEYVLSHQGEVCLVSA